MNTVHFSSERDEWGTPQAFFDVLNLWYGPFTLDPCATVDNAKCKRFYTREQDGLAQSWAGERVFMNPPYGREIGAWCEKAHRSVEAEPRAVVVGLLPARTDTAWWHNWVMKADRIVLLRGRLRFGGAPSGAPFPSCVVIWETPWGPWCAGGWFSKPVLDTIPANVDLANMWRVP